MDKDKEAQWLLLLGVCVRQNVDPCIVLQRDRFRDQRYAGPRSRVLKDLLGTMDMWDIVNVTGYSYRHLDRISKE